MENKTKKRHAIEKAYKEIGIPDFRFRVVDENGWMNCYEKAINRTFDYRTESEDDQVRGYYLYKRPKSLSGLETNNGWISVLDELPQLDKYVLVTVPSGKVFSAIYLFEDGKSYFFDKPKATKHYFDVTHWCPIPKPPIY